MSPLIPAVDLTLSDEESTFPPTSQPSSATRSRRFGKVPNPIEINSDPVSETENENAQAGPGPTSSAHRLSSTPSRKPRPPVPSQLGTWGHFVQLDRPDQIAKVMTMRGRASQSTKPTPHGADNESRSLKQRKSPSPPIDPQLLDPTSTSTVKQSPVEARTAIGTWGNFASWDRPEEMAAARAQSSTRAGNAQSPRRRSTLNVQDQDSTTTSADEHRQNRPQRLAAQGPKRYAPDSESIPPGAWGNFIPITPHTTLRSDHSEQVVDIKPEPTASPQSHMPIGSLSQTVQGSSRANVSAAPLLATDAPTMSETQTPLFAFPGSSVNSPTLNFGHHIDDSGPIDQPPPTPPQTSLTPPVSSAPPAPRPGSWGNFIQVGPSTYPKRPASPARSSLDGKSNTKRAKTRQTIAALPEEKAVSDHMGAETEEVSVAPVSAHKRGPSWATHTPIPRANKPPPPSQPAPSQNSRSTTGQQTGSSVATDSHISPQNEAATAARSTGLEPASAALLPDAEMDELDSNADGLDIPVVGDTEEADLGPVATEPAASTDTAALATVPPSNDAMEVDTADKSEMSPVDIENGEAGGKVETPENPSQHVDSGSPNLGRSSAASAPGSIGNVFAPAQPNEDASSTAIPEWRPVKPPGMDTLHWLRMQKQLRKVRQNSSASAPGLSPSTSAPEVALKPADGPSVGGAASEGPVEETTTRPSISRFTSELTMSRDAWRRVVDEDGGSEVENLLFSSDTSPPSTGPSQEQADTHLGDLHSRLDDPTQVPPEARRGVARRTFDSYAIDRWNGMLPNLTQNAALHRAVFEMYIQEKELESGSIGVVNTVDHDGAPPDMEFEYANEMMYSRSVPDPEKSLGCACDGPCDPTSKSCSCVRRQELYFYGLQDLAGFAYDG